MSICMVNEPGRVFGHALVSRRWKDVVKRKEYDKYRKSMLFILENAEKYALYCPDIYIKSNVLFICYSSDNRYVNFYIEPNERITYEYGVKEGERNFFPWTSKSRMNALSDFVNG